MALKGLRDICNVVLEFHRERQLEEMSEKGSLWYIIFKKIDKHCSCVFEEGAWDSLDHSPNT